MMSRGVFVLVLAPPKAVPWEMPFLNTSMLMPSDTALAWPAVKATSPNTASEAIKKFLSFILFLLFERPSQSEKPSKSHDP
jgi:hypothetical protein